MYAMIVDDNKHLSWQPVSAAALRPGQVRIRIAATAVNRADLMQREGVYPPPPGYSSILGLECAGTIIERGEGVTQFQNGDAVCALLTAGGYATEVVCDARQALAIPAGLTMEQAAALPEVMATAWLNLFELAALQPGERVLLKAGGSGVGTAAIQLCKAMGNPVFVQVGSDDKLQRCIALGADGGFNRHHQSLIDLKSADPFDVVLDPVVGESLADTLKLLNTNGRLVVIGLLGGRYASVDFGRLLMKRLQIIGSTLRSQPIAVKGQLMQQLQDKVWPLLAAREVQPVIDSIMSIHEVEQAHQRIAANENFGKIVLRIEG